jgi:hypothetical protein
VTRLKAEFEALEAQSPESAARAGPVRPGPVSAAQRRACARACVWDSVDIFRRVAPKVETGPKTQPLPPPPSTAQRRRTQTFRLNSERE